MFATLCHRQIPCTTASSKREDALQKAEDSAEPFAGTIGEAEKTGLDGWWFQPITRDQTKISHWRSLKSSLWIIIFKYGPSKTCPELGCFPTKVESCDNSSVELRFTLRHHHKILTLSPLLDVSSFFSGFIKCSRKRRSVFGILRKVNSIVRFDISEGKSKRPSSHPKYQTSPLSPNGVNPLHDESWGGVFPMFAGYL